MIGYKTDDAKLRRDLQKWQKRFGDTDAQAVARLAVGVARHTAVLMEPRGKSKKPIVDAIVKGTRLNVAGVRARTLNDLSKKKRPTFKFGGRWVNLKPGQILRSEAEVRAFVEGNRKSNGQVRKLPPENKAVCKTSDLNKVLVQRKRLAGTSKGAILGGGKRASKFQRGGNRIAIGKNYMAWAQRHDGLGTARRRRQGRGPAIHLSNKVGHTKKSRVLPPRAPKEAARRAWKNTVNYYRRAVKATTR